jgi:hypothetical protein
MATWTWRTVTSTRHEWIIPAAQPWGATLRDLRGAIAAASVAYREHHGLPIDAVLADDALRFHVTDDAVLISFTTEETA